MQLKKEMPRIARLTSARARIFIIPAIVALALSSPVLAQESARATTAASNPSPALIASTMDGKRNNGAVSSDKGGGTDGNAAKSAEGKAGGSHDVDPRTRKANDETTAAEIEFLKGQLVEQQRQIDQLRAELEGRGKPAAATGTGAGSDSATLQPSTAAAGNPAITISPAAQKTGMEPSPLSFRIGSAYVTPIGFVDFTAVFRSTNLGSGIGTNFGSTPFSNTIAGKLDDFRLSAQNSRIGVRVDTDVRDAHVIGYLESDFLGAVPANLNVSTNSDPDRLRLYWVDVTKDKFEVLAGQSWSLLTPNRKGLSPIPGDIFYTQNLDTNYQAGLTWSRDPQVRFVYHASDRVALGLSLENPEQYIGGSSGGGLVTLPAAFAASYATQLDNGTNGIAVPNVHPDIIAKLAFDPKVGNRDFHVEFAGLFRTFRVYNPVNQQHFTTSGGGGSVNANLELVKNFRFITNNFYSDGGGRYIFGQAPDLIIKGDGSPSLIHSASTVTGFEDLVTKNTLLFAYYGGIYIKRNVAVDPTNGKFIGYGYTGSGGGQNRVIHEGTFGFNKTIWKDPKYGALQFIGQYSYLLRRPWYVAPGAPMDAHGSMIFLDLRYVLPGSAPKIK